MLMPCPPLRGRAERQGGLSLRGEEPVARPEGARRSDGPVPERAPVHPPCLVTGRAGAETGPGARHGRPRAGPAPRGPQAFTCLLYWPLCMVRGHPRRRGGRRNKDGAGVVSLLPDGGQALVPETGAVKGLRQDKQLSGGRRAWYQAQCGAPGSARGAAGYFQGRAFDAPGRGLPRPGAWWRLPSSSARRPLAVAPGEFGLAARGEATAAGRALGEAAGGPGGGTPGWCHPPAGGPFNNSGLHVLWHRTAR